jgi:hypothetical protein
MTTRQNVDQLADRLRDYVRAVIDQGQIGGHENVTKALADLHDALRDAFGMKESAP